MKLFVFLLAHFVDFMRKQKALHWAAPKRPEHLKEAEEAKRVGELIQRLCSSNLPSPPSSLITVCPQLFKQRWHVLQGVIF
jgi:hypothetical protein